MTVDAMTQLNLLFYNYADHGGERFGQFFVNRFIRNPWPELFYEQDDERARELIQKWFEDHQYIDHLPPFINKFEGTKYEIQINKRSERPSSGVKEDQ